MWQHAARNWQQATGNKHDIQHAPCTMPDATCTMYFLRPKTTALFFLNADYHILKSAIMQPRVAIRKVREKSFRMRYYELFWTNFDPYNEHFSYVHFN